MKLKARVWMAGEDSACNIIVRPPEHIYIDTPFIVNDERFGKITEANVTKDGKGIDVIVTVDKDKINKVKELLSSTGLVSEVNDG